MRLADFIGAAVLAAVPRVTQTTEGRVQRELPSGDELLAVESFYGKRNGPSI